MFYFSVYNTRVLEVTVTNQHCVKLY